MSTGVLLTILRCLPTNLEELSKTTANSTICTAVNASDYEWFSTCQQPYRLADGKAPPTSNKDSMLRCKLHM